MEKLSLKKQPKDENREPLPSPKSDGSDKKRK